MYVVEKKKGRRQAQRIDEALNISQETKNVMILGKDGKKLIKGMDVKTFELKFG